MTYLNHNEEGLDNARQAAEEELRNRGVVKRVIIDDDNADYFDANGGLVGRIDFEKLRMLHQFFGG